MKSLTHLLAGTTLSISLAATPAIAQGAGGTSPDEQVAEGAAPAAGDESMAAGKPVETKPPNAPDQKPAFPEQTRAPQPAEMSPGSSSAIASSFGVKKYRG